MLACFLCRGISPLLDRILGSCSLSVAGGCVTKRRDGQECVSNQELEKDGGRRCGLMCVWYLR